MKNAKTKAQWNRGGRGNYKETCARKMYYPRVEQKVEKEISPLAKSLAETWVLFASLYTVIGLLNLFIG